MPANARYSPRATAGGALATTIAFALTIAVPHLANDEGKRNVGYLDIARIPTSCYGHTGPDVRVGQYRTDAQCLALLQGDTRSHLAGVLRCTPMLGTLPYQLAAATRLAFNIGVKAFCGSTAARRFNLGDIRGACAAFLPWNKARVNGRLIVVRGLALRRERERAMCMVGVR